MEWMRKEKEKGKEGVRSVTAKQLMEASTLRKQYTAEMCERKEAAHP